jgi:hypothetical protein
VIVFDASVLIAYLDSDDDLHRDAYRLLSESVDEDFGANSLTLAEGPGRAGPSGSAGGRADGVARTRDGRSAVPCRHGRPPRPSTRRYGLEDA